MSNVLVGIIALVVGAAFCLYGIIAMRILITVWSAFVGFALGAGLVSTVGGDGFASGALGWIVGIIVAIVFGLLAYLFYAVAVVVIMASAGFALGSALMVAADVTWNWAIVLVGVVVGIVLAAATVALDLPAILLVVISALGGATAAVGGLMLLTSTLDTADFNRSDIVARVNDSWWWYLVWAVLVIGGILIQFRMIVTDRELREQW